MLVDGRAVGAIVLDTGGAARRYRAAGCVGGRELGAIAVLNLRNAVLLRHVQDLADAISHGRGEPPMFS